MRRSLFTSDGDVWHPTDYSRGPWNPEHCHGGPVSALLARTVEQIGDEDGVDWQIARLTIELFRPIRVAAVLRTVTEVERPGRKISLVAARLLDVEAGDIEVARVRALRIRRADIALPSHPTADVDDMGAPGDGRIESLSWSIDEGGIAFHRSSCTHRWVMGSFDEAGPCRVWIRLDVPVVDDETPSGLQRTAAAADFGNGVSGAIPAEQLTYINPDLTVHLTRPPVGKWIGMSSHSVYGVDGESTGMGWAESALYDASGRLGRSVQSLIIQPG